MSLEKLTADLANLDKSKAELDKKRLELVAEITKAKLAAEPTYLNQIGSLVGSEVKIVKSGAAYYIKKGKVNIAWFNLSQLSGCCGVCVSFHANVELKYRKKGLGSLLNKMRQQIAWDANYTVLLCTDVATNVPQQKILDANGWQKLLTFKNRKTKHDVCLHAIMLKDTGLKVGDKLSEPPKV